jgi:replicative DNA helicase
VNGADRIPPASLDAEQRVIGAMLLDPDHVDVVSEVVVASDFYAHVHEFWFGQIVALHEAGKPVDQVSVAESVRSHRDFDKFGGYPFLSTCASGASAITTESVRYFAELVAENASLRRLIAAGNQIAEIGFSGQADPQQAHADADRVYDAVTADRRTSGDGTSMRSAMFEAYKAIERAAGGENVSSALMSPWPTVNEMTGGFHPGELVTIPAAPGQGKTGMVLTLADWFGYKYGSVALCSFEMNKAAISRRLLAMHANVSARKQKLGDVHDEEWARIAEAASVIATRSITLFGRGSSSLSLLRRELRAMNRLAPIRAVIVDHAGFIADSQSDGSRSTEHERLDRVYRRLLELAEELQTVVFAVQHMNRAGSSGPPTMVNIRGGGNIEGHSHTIIAPYRENPDSPIVAERCVGEFRILKSRDGESGTAPAYFRGWRHLWTESEHDLLWFHMPAERMAGVA